MLINVVQLLFEYNLPVLKYELSLFSYFEISATRSAIRGYCACAHCVHRQPAS